MEYFSIEILKHFNKNKKIAHFREGDYNIIMMNSYFDKVKSLKYFLEDKNED